MTTFTDDNYLKNLVNELRDKLEKRGLTPNEQLKLCRRGGHANVVPI